MDPSLTTMDVSVHKQPSLSAFPAGAQQSSAGVLGQAARTELPIGKKPPRNSSLRQASPSQDHRNSNMSEPNDVGSAYDPRTPGPSKGYASASPESLDYSGDETDTPATSMDLPPLQNRTVLEKTDQMQPLEGDVQGSYDLLAPPDASHQIFSLEKRSEQLFSLEHLQVVFSSPSTLLRFTAFLSAHRPQSIPLLIYYLDALKAIKAIKYSNAVAEALSPIAGLEFSKESCKTTSNSDLEKKAAQAFEQLTAQDLPAYVTQIYIQIVSLSISRRITGNLPAHLREASEGLAEVFCLTDPSRTDNPIVFASEEFNRTTQYGLSYVLGRNCRFLQGPKTNRLSVKRLASAVASGQEHCELFLNYRRDGSPFMNLLMIAPLCDSRGKIRYFIGAQVDVSGLVKDCTDLDSLRELAERQAAEEEAKAGSQSAPTENEDELKDDFQQLSEMLNMSELDTVKKHGGRMHREYQDENHNPTESKTNVMPRLLLQEPATEPGMASVLDRSSGRLQGIYRNYLLIRPYPSFRILFASPTLRVPGILQTPFMDKIGGSSRVRNELASAFAEGRGVTAKVRWLSRPDEGGRNRWIHCTPLIGNNGLIGAWMIVVVDDEQQAVRRWREAPPVEVSPRTRSQSTSQKAPRSKVGSTVSRDGRGSLEHSSRPFYEDPRVSTPVSVDAF